MFKKLKTCEVPAFLSDFKSLFYMTLICLFIDTFRQSQLCFVTSTQFLYSVIKELIMRSEESCVIMMCSSVKRKEGLDVFQVRYIEVKLEW